LKSILLFGFFNLGLLTYFEKIVDERFDNFMNESEILVERSVDERSRRFEALLSS
jgi:hypothetical protein